jgi:hypothetical protein
VAGRDGGHAAAYVNAVFVFLRDDDDLTLRRRHLLHRVHLYLLHKWGHLPPLRQWLLLRSHYRRLRLWQGLPVLAA